ncbi:hypothetical protein [Clostridium beijerinckii]|nr:hypothetical protein [Clostridium beijerinckii]
MISFNYEVPRENQIYVDTAEIEIFQIFNEELNNVLVDQQEHNK